MIEEWEQIRREDVSRKVAFGVLQKYLPPGTQITSGYRSPQDQLNLIRRYAQRYNSARPDDPIPLPAKMEVNDQASWEPVLRALRARGFVMNAPTATPHTTVDAVFDLAGAELQQIMAGCRAAERAGRVQFRQLLLEPQNNAVHVDVPWVAPQAFADYGKKSAGPPPDGGESPEDIRRREELTNLQNLLRDEPLPAKRIDYLERMILLYDPLKNASDIRALRDEIEKARQELKRIEADREKEAAIERMSLAMRLDDFDQAERLAAQFEQKFPDDKQVKDKVNQVRTSLRVSEVSGILIREEEDRYQRADQLTDEALAFSPGHRLATNYKNELKVRRQSARFKLGGLIAIAIAALAGLCFGLYFLFLKPGRWILEVVEGPNFGEVFALQQPETVVGAADGEADFLIWDDDHRISRRHCVIKQHGRRFHLTDESSNGTKVNDQWVEDEGHWLRRGDRISLADAAELLFRRQ